LIVTGAVLDAWGAEAVSTIDGYPPREAGRAVAPVAESFLHQVCGAGAQLQEAFFRGAKTLLPDPMDQGDELAETARKYLDLWMEHWASCLNSPETLAAMTRALAWATGAISGLQPGYDNGPTAPVQGHEPQALRTAPSSGGRRVDELEERIAELERRLADVERERGASVAKPAGRPRRRARPV
jgi:hypothetical protein